MSDVMTITRETFRGGLRFTIKCERVTIEFAPSKIQRYEIAEILHGGGFGELQLPCELFINPDWEE